MKRRCFLQSQESAEKNILKRSSNKKVTVSINLIISRHNLKKAVSKSCPDDMTEIRDNYIKA